MSIKISIPGGNGRMGKTLIKEIIDDENLEMSNFMKFPKLVKLFHTSKFISSFQSYP